MTNADIGVLRPNTVSIYGCEATEMTPNTI